MIDGGPGAEPKGTIDAWLVADDQSELIGKIRKLAKSKGVRPAVGDFVSRGLSIKAKRVAHTNHVTFGYQISAGDKKIVWAPEFFVFPRWATGCDLMFADAAGWNKPINFRGGVGGHACVANVARDAVTYQVKKLIFAHIGRPTIRAIDAGEGPAFGEFGKDGAVYEITRSSNEGTYQRIAGSTTRRTSFRFTSAEMRHLAARKTGGLR